MKPCLGYRQKPDKRDANFPLSDLLVGAGTRPVSKHWKSGSVLDQSNTNSCVGHACYLLQVSEPVATVNPKLGPFDIYVSARQQDEWTDNDFIDRGTSIRAGLSVLKNAGIISAYYQTQSGEVAREYAITKGPLVVGIRWPDSMLTPDANGVIKPRGVNGGGHAVFITSVQWKEKMLTIQNSWGTGWGKRGFAKISFSDFDRLLAEMGATAAAVVEP